MELLKCCLEASNAAKKADDNAVNICFDKIISNVFGDKRGLIKYLLTPHHKLNKDAFIKIKVIFNNEFKRLMDAKDEESDDEDIDIEKVRIIPTLANISEHMQAHITSFLDFPSIKRLSAVCSSTAPIALSQFSKIDIKICNIHQLSNEEQHIKSRDIIESNTKIFRVRRSENIKVFSEDKLGIAPENLLSFSYYSWTERASYLNESTFSSFKGDSSSYSMIYGDKTKINVIAKQPQNDIPMVLFFIQEFDVKEQRLKIKHVVKTNNNELLLSDIKNVIGCDADENVSFACAPRHYGEPVLQRLTGNSALYYRDLRFSSVIYQINDLSDIQIDGIRSECYRNCEPFYTDFYAFQQSRIKYKAHPGSKYTDLAIKLRKRGFDGTEILKCYKKAYDINPNDSLFVYNYVVTLRNIDPSNKLAHKICLEALQLHKNDKMYIPDDDLWEFYRIAAEMYNLQKKFESALEYYKKSIGVIRRILARSGPKDLKLALCEIYHRMVDVYNSSSLRIDQETIGREQYEKIIKIFPNSAFYSLAYSTFLRESEEIENYEEAIDGIDHALYLMNKNKDETPQYECSLYDCYREKFKCLMGLKEYKKAEEIALKLIEISKCESDEYLRKSYERIIDLYKHNLQDPRNAEKFEAVMTEIPD